MKEKDQLALYYLSAKYRIPRSLPPSPSSSNIPSTRVSSAACSATSLLPEPTKHNELDDKEPKSEGATTSFTGVRTMPFLDRGARKPQSKRIIICCDGTWQNSDEGDDEKPTNVTRIGRALKSVSKEGIPQIVFYQNGVGTSGTASRLSRMIAGGTGKGLSENIREAYLFLANNYHPGDGIYLFGFSRGAYTARSLAGLIGRIGILTKKGMDYFPQIYRDYTSERLRDDDYVASQVQWDRIKDVRITIVGCWDTVGSLGLPESWFTRYTGVNNKYKFHDTALGPGIENAFHALALDERRKPFSPTLWRLLPRHHSHENTNNNNSADNTKKKMEEGVTASQILPKGNSSTDAPQVSNKPTVLKQVWFPGVHTNVGGGYPDQEIANITLLWMVEQCLPFLTFDPEYLESLHPLPDIPPHPVAATGTDDNTAEMQTQINKTNSHGHWSNGKVYNSYTGITRLAGAKIRTPGEYYTAERTTELSSTGVLGHTNEEIHPCVRARHISYSSNPAWRSAALSDDWEIHRTTVNNEERWMWVSEKRKVALLESVMGPGEVALCGKDMEEKLKGMNPPEAVADKGRVWSWTWFRRSSRPDKMEAVGGGGGDGGTWKSRRSTRRSTRRKPTVERIDEAPPATSSTDGADDVDGKDPGAMS